MRFHPRLAFAGSAVSCRETVMSGQQGKKEKIERSIAYLQQSFWPLRSFTNLSAVKLQVCKWLEEVADQHAIWSASF